LEQKLEGILRLYYKGKTMQKGIEEHGVDCVAVGDWKRRSSKIEGLKEGEKERQ
jgi:hypothetical protein